MAEIAGRHDVRVVEDDIHVFLADEPPLPVAARLMAEITARWIRDGTVLEDGTPSPTTVI